jgi:hypothetical protein
MSFEQSRAAFEAYASGENVPNSFWPQTQVRLAQWQNRVYGPQPDWVFVLGIVEEFGEYFAATDFDAENDAKHDIVIFAMQLCTNVRLDFGVLFRDWRDYQPLNAGVGQLSHACLKRSQMIRGMDDVEVYRESIYNGLREMFPWQIDEEELTKTVDMVTARTKDLPRSELWNGER